MSKKQNRKSNIDEIKSQLKPVELELKDGVFTFTGPLSVQEFAQKLNVSPNKIITHFFKQGKAFNINHILTEEQIMELCLEFGYDFDKKTEINASNFMEEIEISDQEKDMVIRPAIITIMGHVDHGKTTFLDYIRKTHVVKSEAGGITQHIGAYQIEHKGKKITFLDTPGHEAFTAMRARGAKVTDIVILVVAADDGLMPQTEEAIDHAKAAKVPMIVFINKMDKPNIDPERIKAELAKKDIVSEEWGGDTQFIYGSGLTGKGVEELLEAINLQSELLELKANPNRYAMGTVIESKIDKGKGVVATLIIQNGTLLKKDFVVAGHNYGNVRMMFDSLGKPVDKAEPGMPVVLTGLNYSPNAGDKFFAFPEEKFAKSLANEKKEQDHKVKLQSKIPIQVEEGIKILNLIIKSDVQGTAEAIKQSLEKISNEEVKINIISASIGVISKSDLLLAQASKAIIFAFNIKPSPEIKKMSQELGVDIRTDSVIYKIVEDVEALINNMKKPVFEEQVVGKALIIKVIFFSKIGNIAGSRVIEGKIKSNHKVRLIRNDKVIATSRLDSLQQGKNNVKEVSVGFEFGAHIKDFNDIKEGDIIECFTDVEVK